MYDVCAYCLPTDIVYNYCTMENDHKETVSPEFLLSRITVVTPQSLDYHNFVIFKSSKRLFLTGINDAVSPSDDDYWTLPSASTK